MESFTLKLKKTLKLIFMRNVLNTLKNLKKKYEKSKVADMIKKLSEFEIKNSEKINKIMKYYRDILDLLEVISNQNVEGVATYKTFIMDYRKFIFFIERKFTSFRKIQIQILSKKERTLLMLQNKQMVENINQILKAKYLAVNIKRIIRRIKSRQIEMLKVWFSFPQTLPDMPIPTTELSFTLKELTLIREMDLDPDEVFGQLIMWLKVKEKQEKEEIVHISVLNKEMVRLNISINSKDIKQSTRKLLIKFKTIFEEIIFKINKNDNHLQKFLLEKGIMLKGLIMELKKIADTSWGTYINIIMSMMKSFMQIQVIEVDPEIINVNVSTKIEIEVTNTFRTITLETSASQLKKIIEAIEGDSEEEFLKGIKDEIELRKMKIYLKKLRILKERCKCNIYSIFHQVETKKECETIEIEDNVKVITETIEIVKEDETKENSKNSLLKDSQKLLQAILGYISSNNPEVKRILDQLKGLVASLKEDVKSDRTLTLKIRTKVVKILEDIEAFQIKLNYVRDKTKMKEELGGFYGALDWDRFPEKTVFNRTKYLIKSMIQFIEEKVPDEPVKSLDEMQSLFKKLLADFEEETNEKIKAMVEDKITKIRLVLKFLKQKEEEKNPNIKYQIIFEKQTEQTREIIKGNDDLGEEVKLNLNKILEAQILIRDIIKRSQDSITDTDIEEFKKLVALIKNAVNGLKDKEESNSDVLDILQLMLENLEVNSEKIVEQYKKEKFEDINGMIESLNDENMIEVKSTFSIVMQLVMKIEDLGLESFSSKERSKVEDYIQRMEALVKSIIENDKISDERKKLVDKIRKQVDYMTINIRKYFYSVDVSSRLDDIEDFINQSSDDEEDEETSRTIDRFIEEHRKYEELMKKAYIEGIATFISSERERLFKMRERMRKYFDNLFLSKKLNFKLKEKFFDLKLKINEDEMKMREQLRDQKFKDIETLG